MLTGQVKTFLIEWQRHLSCSAIYKWELRNVGLQNCLHFPLNMINTHGSVDEQVHWLCCRFSCYSLWEHWRQCIDLTDKAPVNTSFIHYAEDRIYGLSPLSAAAAPNWHPIRIHNAHHRPIRNNLLPYSTHTVNASASSLHPSLLETDVHPLLYLFTLLTLFIIHLLSFTAE